MRVAIAAVREAGQMGRLIYNSTFGGIDPSGGIYACAGAQAVAAVASLLGIGIEIVLTERWKVLFCCEDSEDGWALLERIEDANDKTLSLGFEKPSDGMRPESIELNMKVATLCISIMESIPVAGVGGWRVEERKVA